MDTVSDTSAPPWARKMWYDNRFIFLEMPVVGAAPITLKYSFTEDGLSKALKMMKVVAETDSRYVPRNGHAVPDHPVVKRKSRGLVSTGDVRATAAKLLRKVGIIK